MTEMEKTAAERLQKAMEQFLLTPCPNSAPCVFCELERTCERVRALYYEVKQKLGEEVKNL